MNCINFAREFIENKGFEITDQNEDHISFRYQMNNVHLFADDDEDDFAIVTIPNFIDINDDNILQVKDICNQVNAEKKMVKMFVAQNVIFSSSEIFFLGKEDFLFNFEKAFKTVIAAKTLFKRLYI